MFLCFLILLATGLLEAILQSEQAPNIIFLLVLLEKIVALWNFYIDGFIEITFEVNIWNFNLLNFKTKICSKCH